MSGVDKSSILVVEDSPENIDVLVNLLRSDYDVRVAINGEMALEVVNENYLPDIILLDVLMPGMNGFEVCETLHNNPKYTEIPIIFISAMHEVTDRVKGFDVGGVDFISKPFQPSEVLARVNVHLSLRKTQKELQAAKDELENRVAQRTKELQISNESLKLAHVKLRSSEEKYRSLIDSAPDAVIVTDIDGAVRIVNYEFSKIFGYDQIEIEGKSVQTLLRSYFDKYVDAVVGLGADLMEDKSISTFSFDAKHKDGHYFPAEVSFSYINVGSDEMVIADVRDVSDRKMLEEQLQTAQKMEMLGQLSGGIAHDINNVLNAMLGYAELVVDDISPDNEEMKNDVGEIIKAGNLGQSMIKQMMAFSRKNTVNIQEVHIQNIVEDVATIVSQVLPDGIDFSYDIEDKLSPVMTDSVELNRVVTNLCTNARDAMPQGGSLSVRAYTEHVHSKYCASCHMPLSDDYVMLEVKDTGSGIEKENLEKIFETLYTTKAVGSGTGMGLSVVNEVVHKSHGHIVVESEVGKGTTFYLMLPQAKDTVLDTNNQGAGYKVAIVSEELSVSRMMAAILEAHAYEVVVINNVSDVKEEIKEQSPKVDLVISQYNNNIFPGLQVPLQFNQTLIQYPFVMYCTQEVNISRSQQTELGVRRILQVPVDTQMLLSTLLEILPR